MSETSVCRITGILSFKVLPTPRARSLVQPSGRLSHQFVRYGFVGGLAYSIDLIALFALTEFLGIHYLVSAVFAYLLGLVVNYLLSIRWVFNNRNVTDPRMEFLVFTLVGVVGLLLNVLLLWGFAELLMLHYMVSKGISAFITFPTKFALRKLVLFRS